MLGVASIANPPYEGSAIVREVVPGSAADGVGIEVGDRIVPKLSGGLYVLGRSQTVLALRIKTGYRATT